MSEGVRTFTTEGQQPVTFKALPAGDYDLKLLSDTAEIRTAKGKAPRVSVSWEMLNTGKDGKKNRRLYSDFYTSLVPGQDGVAMPSRGGQVIDLAACLGEKFTGNMMTFEVDDNQGNSQSVDVIDARDLLNWLKSKSGAIVRAKVKIKPAKDGYPEKNDVARFIPPEGNQVAGLGADAPVNHRLLIHEE